MNAFANVKVADDVAENEDRVGGNFDPVPTGIHDFEIKMAYALTSASGANGISLELEGAGKTVRETVYFTKRTGETYYHDKKDSKIKRELPGFILLNDICLFCTEKLLLEQNFEEKLVKQYDPEAKKEVNKPAQVAVDLLGKTVKLAVFQTETDKEKKDASGNYQPTGETRMINELEKAVHPETSRTINEYKHDVQTPEWATEWLKVNTNADGSPKIRNKVKHGKSGGAGTSGSGMFGGGAGGAEGGAKKKLFGN